MTKHTLTIKEVMLIVIIAIVFGVVYKIWGPVYTFANAIAERVGICGFIYPQITIYSDLGMLD